MARFEDPQNPGVYYVYGMPGAPPTRVEPDPDNPATQSRITIPNIKTGVPQIVAGDSDAVSQALDLTASGGGASGGTQCPQWLFPGLDSLQTRDTNDFDVTLTQITPHSLRIEWSNPLSVVAAAPLRDTAFVATLGAARDVFGLPMTAILYPRYVEVRAQWRSPDPKPEGIDLFVGFCDSEAASSLTTRFTLWSLSVDEQPTPEATLGFAINNGTIQRDLVGNAAIQGLYGVGQPYLANANPDQPYNRSIASTANNATQDPQTGFQRESPILAQLATAGNTLYPCIVLGARSAPQPAGMIDFQFSYRGMPRMEDAANGTAGLTLPYP